jgi:hypothetical protein
MERACNSHQRRARHEQEKERLEMDSSSIGKPSTKERLKEMDKALENLKQLLQHRLDFLENLDMEAGRRMEQLEADIITTKIGFLEELDKLHKEIKNPQQEFEERMDQLEAKMAQLNSDWTQDSKNQSFSLSSLSAGSDQQFSILYSSHCYK